ncbi:MAG: tRNA A-37 threonylcarbamoyl transferase component Bud32 [Pseudohongiellaceae bacterium]|jgi:tRNA A-37 threonylcarbamoyl transferase component Bud32
MGYASKDLVELGRNISTPFTVSLLDEGIEADLEILDILRFLPGKRLTAVASMKGEKVVAKLFFHPQAWKRKLKKELSGMQEFAQHQLATPKVLSQHSIKGSGAVILIEYLETGISLADYFSNEKAVTALESQKVWSLLFNALCSCHNTGLWQGDMHLGNYMLFQDQLYLVDGGDVQQLRKPLQKARRLENIADFISQFPVSFDDQAQWMLESYQAGYMEFSPADLGKVRPRVQSLRIQRLGGFEKKMFRSTSANRKAKTSTYHLVHSRTLQEHDLATFIKNPDSYVKQDQMLKDGHTTTVVQASIGGIAMVLKRYNIVGVLQSIKHLFVESRAHRCWRNASMLGLLGIHTPRAYLFLEERFYWAFQRRSYFLTEKIQANNVLLQLEDANEKVDEAKLIAAFANLFEIMYSYQISHGDMKATNFIFQEDKLYVLDLDAMQRHRFKWWSRKRSMSDIKRFEKNWVGSRYEQVFAPMIKKYHENRRA